MKTLIYLHGYNSSPQSHKAQLTIDFIQNYYPQWTCIAPQIPYAPVCAIDLLKGLVDAVDQPVFIGSSLGGYYANYLAEYYGCKAVLVNPAITPHRLLSAYLGLQKNNYTGETYTLTEQHMIELRELKVSKLIDPKNRFLLTQTLDETLDFLDAAEYYQDCRSVIEYGGNHSFTRFGYWLAEIVDFLDN